ncbi:dihydropyrimidinase [Tissierella carlieri]|jgi:dihydropyrimidinase|uniref:dihydropyrimidinase n=1 Tax=Tissierella carlieri TaxID=689904 RepID=UPI001C0F50CF|nr:dihydropyrimidinase [Tissierella carlieri]MBU5312978.1 dihydropyrimidinase [Tissierella carlieri]
MSLLIKNGVIVTAMDEYQGDILVDEGKIIAIGNNLDSKADEVIDAKGMYVLPGGVDQHVHFSFEFNGSKVRGFETSNAAAVGGTTTVIEFVNQIKGKGLIDTIDEYRKENAEGIAMVDYSFHGIITDPSTGVYDEIAKLPEAGYPTVKLFMAYKGMFFHCDDDVIAKSMQKAKDAGVTIMVHAENADLIDVLQKECVEQGNVEPYYHAVSRPPMVETEATERAINIARLMDAPLYVVHVSTKGAVDAIKRAQDEGLPVYGETCTHYLTLDKENLAKPNFQGAKYVCSPALREQDDIDYLWTSIKNGWLNAISSDHCGFNWAEQKHMGKDDFRNIPNGAPGLENRLGVLWTAGVETGKITRSQLVDLFATKPAKINGLGDRKGHLGIGYDADIVIYNPNVKSIISNETSLQGVDYNSYEGFEQIGRPEKVFLRGQLVVDEGKYIGEKGQGEFVPGKPYGLCYDGIKK